ncbi:hypothetical protein HGRIS_010548 [Hohenbuehelia grisea]|uniref:Uncharacterized protein n=1 Tax=Hohenbuehelia grisea TaxID=104357 RepID=A0ABR3IX91_9AGAR
MSTTRQRTMFNMNNGSTPSVNTTSNNMPPPRKSKPMKDVDPPLSSARLNRFIYILVALTALFGAYYSYRVVQYKAEVGGWWNLALGKKPPQLAPQAGGAIPGNNNKGSKKGQGKDTVEDRINALAEALGMPSRELASAIAGAVRNYVPPASLSSVAAEQTGPAVEELLREQDPAEKQRQQAAPGAQATGVAGAVVSGMESFVGMDEP